MEKFVAIYVRRSVSDKDKGNNSLSIASQKADCLKELKKGEKYRIYCDDGKSGHCAQAGISTDDGGCQGRIDCANHCQKV